MKNLIRSFTVIISFIALIFYTGCDSTETTDGNVSISFAPSNITQKISDDTIQFDTVKILLRDIKIKNQSGNDEMNIKVGPFVVYLNLNGMTTDFALNNVPPGSYDRIRFRVHTLEDSEALPDPEFKEGSLRYSVIVKGMYNSVPFIYKSKKSPPNWFYKDNVLMDPNDPANENDINNNIEHSFKKCFRDDDKDGK